MKEVSRCWAWVPDVSDIPQSVSVLEDGTYMLDGDWLESDLVTEIPPAEWLRANEADFRDLLEACHTLVYESCEPGFSEQAWAVMRDIVDRRWRAEE